MVKSVASALVRQDDDVLLIRHKSSFLPDVTFWTLPGGKVELGETFLRAAVREIYEEAGLKVTEDMAKLAYACEYSNSFDKTAWRIEVYEFKEFDGEVHPNDPDDEILEARFFDLEEAIELLSQQTWPMVKEPAIAYLRQDAFEMKRLWRYQYDGRFWQSY